VAQNTDIGKVIEALSPYIKDRWVGKGGSYTGDMDVYMLHQPHQGGSPNGTIPQMQIEVDAAYPADWTFKGQPYKLGKAARMAYRFPVLDAPNGNVLYWVEDYILIGFADGGV
jgi:hypothetical protein